MHVNLSVRAEGTAYDFREYGITLNFALKSQGVCYGLHR